MLEWLVVLLTASPPTDLLRLVAVPVFGWAAYRDVRTRRVPNRTWPPLAALGVALLLWDAWRLTTGFTPVATQELFFMRVAISLGMVAPLGYIFYWLGGFGGADAKALIVIAVLFPTFPTYFFPGVALPLTRTTVGVFSLTVLTNTVLAGAAYPLAVAGRNALRGHLAPAMLIGKPVPAADLTGEYGSLLETPEGFTRSGLDLDALRMYLRWRGCTLAEVRADPDAHRDPSSLPARPNSPGDGSIRSDRGDDEATDAEGRAGETVDPDPDDEWGAEAFLDDIEGDAYGTTPETLRDGLDVVAASETVWVSPGLPFVVPMFVGLLVSLVYGDLFVTLVAALV